MKVTVPNMTCGHCKMAIEKALKEEGFKFVDIDLASKTVEFDLEGKSSDQAVKAIQAKGYDVEL